MDLESGDWLLPSDHAYKSVHDKLDYITNLLIWIIILQIIFNLLYWFHEWIGFWDLDTDINNWIIPIDIICWIFVPVLIFCCVFTMNNTFVLYGYSLMVASIIFIVLCSIKMTYSFQYADLREINRDFEDIMDDIQDDIDSADNIDGWDTKTVVNWIINIDKQRLNKYYNVLLESMSTEGIDGSCLQYLDKDDLHRLGIMNYKDKLIILAAIKQLSSSSNAD